MSELNNCNYSILIPLDSNQYIQFYWVKNMIFVKPISFTPRLMFISMMYVVTISDVCELPGDYLNSDICNLLGMYPPILGLYILILIHQWCIWLVKLYPLG